MYHKVAAIINYIFAVLIGVACGLVCYYYCWLSDWKQVWKIFAMIGFSIWGLLGMFMSGFTAWLMFDDYGVDSDKGDIQMGIFTLIIAFVVPGVLYLIFLHVGVGPSQFEKQMNKYRREHPESSSGTTANNVPKVKKQMPKYDPDEDPAVIKKTKPTGGIGAPKKSAPSSTVSKPKKKLVK